MSVKISELDPVNDLFEGCCFPLVQNDETRKVTYQTLKNKIAEDMRINIQNVVSTLITNKVDKEPGKGLSTNDFTDEAYEKLWSIPDTLYANGADYAEVAQWYDNNPNSEDRLHRFVTLKTAGRKIAIANSTDQIVGVTTVKAAFVGNAYNYEDGDVDPTKSIVGIIGVVQVKTNDSTIEANDRVMSDENGYAIKSSNNLGYRVLEVLENGLLEIVVSPNTDMIQRIKTHMIELEEKIELLIENGGGSGSTGGLFIEKDPTVPSWAKQPKKPSYTAQEVGALPSNTKIPSKTSDLANDSDYQTSTQVNTAINNALQNFEPGEGSGGTFVETDPTVPDWAKQPTKPSYTAQEVGAMPANTAIPTKTSQLENDSINPGLVDDVKINGTSVVNNKIANIDLSEFAKKQYVNEEINELKDTQFSGNYEDLNNKPKLFDGNYDSLNGKPSIPSKTSDLQNDSNFQTGEDVIEIIEEMTKDITIPTKTSDLINDKAFQTDAQVGSAIKQAVDKIEQSKILTVSKLPEVGENNTIYLVPKQNVKQTISVDVPENDTPLVNPWKGFWFQGYPSVNEYLDNVSLVYYRFSWNEIEKTEGNFSWKIVDDFINTFAPYGRKFAFGVMAYSGVWGGKEYGTPQWVFDAGAKYRTMPVGDDGVLTTIPIWNDPIFIQKMTNFINAMAERYDGNPNIEFIDIRSYGIWGEQHNYGIGGEAYDITAEEVKTLHIQPHINAFKKTRLMIPWGRKIYNDVYEWAIDQGLALRRDGILRESNGSECMMAYGKTPSLFEYSDGYTNIKNAGLWSQEKLLTSIENGRPTYLELDQAMCAENQDFVNGLLNKIGYYFRLKKVQYSNYFAPNETEKIKVYVENEGVAPLYENAYVYIALLDENNNIIKKYPTTINPKTWEPNVLVAEEVNLQISNVNNGQYELAIGLFLNEDDENPTYLLGNDNKTDNNWYKIGTINIGDNYDSISSESNKYDEYFYVGEKYEKIGLDTSDVEEMINTAISNIINADDIAY